MLALIAGQGDLPSRIASRCQKWPLIASLEGFPPDELIPEISFRLETLGTLLHKLAQAGVHQVCFAGAIRRPKVDMSLVDMATAPLVPRLIAALGQGDDGALRVIIEIFQDAGFSVMGVDELVPEYLPDAGCVTKVQPDDTHLKDVTRAQDVLENMADLDIGQGCVIAAHQTLAIETFGGTDWMLHSLIGTRGSDWPSGGTLYKAPKKGQDRRVDLPTIGSKTIRMAAKAGLSGVCVEAGGVMVLDPETVIETANELGVFLLIQPKKS